MTTLAQDLTGMARQSFRWWRGELASLIPPSLKRKPGMTEPGIVIALQEGRLSLVSDKSKAGQAMALGDGSEPALLDHLARTSRAGGNPMIVRLRLPYSACLVRRLEVPERAEADAERILALDLERATPLNREDVYTANTRDPSQSGSGKGTISIVQLIVKRSMVDRAVEQLQLAGANVDAVDCWSENGRTALPVNFLGKEPGGKASNGKRTRRRALLLTSLAAGLAASAAGISIDRHQNALASLEQQTADARATVAKQEAQQGSTTAAVKDSASVLKLKSERPAVVQILDELTRLLPETVYLNEFSVDGDTVDISGFAKRSAELVPLLERSKMFAGAALSAPVTFDESRDKERFSYRLRLRQARATEPPTDAGEASP